MVRPYLIVMMMMVAWLIRFDDIANDVIAILNHFHTKKCDLNCQRVHKSEFLLGLAFFLCYPRFVVSLLAVRSYILAGSEFCFFLFLCEDTDSHNFSELVVTHTALLGLRAKMRENELFTVFSTAANYLTHRLSTAVFFT